MVVTCARLACVGCVRVVSLCALLSVVLWDSFVPDQEHLSLMVLFLMWTCSPFTLDTLAVICNVLIFLLISFCFNPTSPSLPYQQKGEASYFILWKPYPWIYCLWWKSKHLCPQSLRILEKTARNEKYFKATFVFLPAVDLTLRSPQFNICMVRNEEHIRRENNPFHNSVISCYSLVFQIFFVCFLLDCKFHEGTRNAK